MDTRTIVVLEGDETGQELLEEALRVLQSDVIGVELEFPCKQMVLDCIGHGVLLNCTHDYTLRMLPPYIITEQEVDRAISVLKRVFKNAKPPAA